MYARASVARARTDSRTYVHPFYLPYACIYTIFMLHRICTQTRTPTTERTCVATTKMNPQRAYGTPYGAMSKICYGGGRSRQQVDRRVSEQGRKHPLRVTASDVNHGIHIQQQASVSSCKLL